MLKHTHTHTHTHMYTHTHMLALSHTQKRHTNTVWVTGEKLLPCCSGTKRLPGGSPQRRSFLTDPCHWIHKNLSPYKAISEEYQHQLCECLVHRGWWKYLSSECEEWRQWLCRMTAEEKKGNRLIIFIVFQSVSLPRSLYISLFLSYCLSVFLSFWVVGRALHPTHNEFRYFDLIYFMSPQLCWSLVAADKQSAGARSWKLSENVRLLINHYWRFLKYLLLMKERKKKKRKNFVDSPWVGVSSKITLDVWGYRGYYCASCVKLWCARSHYIFLFTTFQLQIMSVKFINYLSQVIVGRTAMVVTYFYFHVCGV